MKVIVESVYVDYPTRKNVFKELAKLFGYKSVRVSPSKSLPIADIELYRVFHEGDYIRCFGAPVAWKEREEHIKIKGFAIIKFSEIEKIAEDFYKVPVKIYIEEYNLSKTPERIYDSEYPLLMYD